MKGWERPEEEASTFGTDGIAAAAGGSSPSDWGELLSGREGAGFHVRMNHYLY